MGSLLSRVSTTAQALPSRVFIYAREKWGKSSLFAHAPGAIFFMTRGETGLLELISGGRVPPTAHFDYDEQAPPTWATLRQAVKELSEEEHPHKALVIDTCNGAEILCQEHVRKTQFNGSAQKFASYGKGWELCRIEWLALLQDLDALRSRRKMSVVLLAHTRVKKFDDPTQEEGYDKYQPACQDKLWDLTHKWSDIIAFGHFRSETYETESGKTKARAEMRRVLCFDTSPMWEAGNRYGLSGELNVGNGAGNGFKAFSAAVARAKAATAPAASKPANPPPPPVQAPAPQPAPTAPAAQEGEQRPDPTPATSATPPETPTPSSAKNGASSAAGAPTNAPAPPPTSPPVNPTPARPAPLRAPASPGSDVPGLLALLHQLGLSWPEVRDRAEGLGAELAEACAIYGTPGLQLPELGLSLRSKLYAECEVRVQEKKARAAKRAANKAAREAREAVPA
ncbi:MAG TPA: AAA family ATPase [Gemmata sp.]